MGSSSLWIITNEMKGENICEFENFMLFSPVILDYLLYKYIPVYKTKKKGYLKITSNYPIAQKDLHLKIYKSKDFEDKILWGLCNNMIFYTKDKKYIITAIESFMKKNKELVENDFNILNRFNEIIKNIEDDFLNKNPFFMFKRFSFEYDILSWFSNKNNLLKTDTHYTYFVVIENKNVKYVSNIDIKRYIDIYD